MQYERVCMCGTLMEGLPEFTTRKSNMAWRTPISRVCDVYRTAAAGCRVRVTTRPYRTPKSAAGGGPAALAGAGGCPGVAPPGAVPIWARVGPTYARNERPVSVLSPIF